MGVGRRGKAAHGAFPVLVLAILLAFFFSLCAGQYDIDPLAILEKAMEMLGIPVRSGAPLTAEQEAVLLHIRAPRTLVGFLAGAGLAVSGAVLQGIFRNPLADPGIIGATAGASLGACLAIGMGLASGMLLALPVAAFLGAIFAALLAVALAMRHGRIGTLALLLSGVVVGMFLAAVTAAVLTSLDASKMQQYLFWTIGSLDYRRWDHVLLGLFPILISALLMMALSRHLDILALGEAEARAVGMRVTAYRAIFLALAALSTATAVCISGSIGFVGLVVPHAVRLLLGPGYRRLLPASFLAGGAFLVFCDAAGRILLPTGEIRVGIMTAFLGAPYFLFLLRRYVYRI